MQTLNLIGGQWVGAADHAQVTDPATDEPIASVPRAGVAETRQAIDAAHHAFPEWAARTADQRAHFLRAIADRMLQQKDQLARILTTEQGKPLTEAAGEIAYAASFLHWSAEEARRVYGETIPASTPDKRILVLKQPVGVTAAITPWNFPAAMITRKLGPALAMGCTMVVKPAEQTPLTALAIAQIACDVGLPPGVFNIITGHAPTIGGAIFADPRVRKVSFTGSTAVGKILMKQAAENVTRLSLELGGHAPFIVFDDADLDAAVQGAIASKFRNAGQTCVCANRILVHKPIHQKFLHALANAVEKLKVGRGTTPGVTIGPLIDDRAAEKVQNHLDDALARGATLVTGGKRTRPEPNLTERFFTPAVIDNWNTDMLLASEETFGPVAPVRAFQDEHEAIEIANNSPFGLAAYFYTRDASRLLRVAERLDYGIVGANDALPSTAQAPFGGVKESGFGREGGKYAMDEYTSIKYVSWGGHHRA